MGGETLVINESMDALAWLCKRLETDDNDLLREMVRSFAEGLMGADAERYEAPTTGRSLWSG